MAKEIIQSSEINQGKFTLSVKNTPLSKPECYQMDSGVLLCEITKHIPDGKGSVYVNGLQCADSGYKVESGDVVEVVISPNEAVSASVILTTLITSLAGAAVGFLLFRPPDPDSGVAEEDFARISGLRNSERRYEPTGLVLGKRKVAPYYISRPYTLVEGDSEYFYALMSAGYGPLKLSNARIGEIPLSEFDHEITYLDHFENTSVEDVYNAYNADISQEPINQLLNVNDDFTLRSVGAGSNNIDLDFLWPAGSYRITRSKGRTRAYQSSVRVDFEQGGTRYTAIRVVNQSSDIVGGAYNTGSGWRIKTESGNQPINVIDSFGAYVLVANLDENVIAASVYHSSPIKRQIAKSISIPVDSDLATTVYVKKQYPTQDIVDDLNPVSEIQWLNLKSRRPLDFEKFQKAIGGERPLLRYEGESGFTSVETYRPTVIAIKLKATAQLNGELDNFSIDAEMCVPSGKDADWRNWPALDLEPSNNPADAYKWVMQGPANYSPVPIEKIDHESLSSWRQRCEDENWSISDHLTSESTLLEEMKNIAFVGRSDFSFREGKFGVVEKVERTLPVQMFTNKNSANFQSSRSYPEDVDGIKFEFDNAERDYEKDEAIFLDPAKADDITKQKGRFQRVTIRGVDNYEQAYRLARFFYYEQTLQRETYSLTTDIEGLRCSRGDLVYIQNDVIRVSLGSGRIKSIDGNTVVIDEKVELEDRIGDTLGIVVRDKQGNFFFEDAVYNGNGEWDCDLPNSADVGDLVIYGESGNETIECIVQKIEYNEDLTINITLVNAANIIYQRDDDFIPEFESVVTPPTEVEIPSAPLLYETPSVNLDNNEVTLTLLDTDNNRLNGLFYTVQYRAYQIDSSIDDATDWETVATGLQGDLRFNLLGLQQGYTYEFRVQARRNNSTFSSWSNTATVDIDFGSEMPGVEGLSFTNKRSGTLLQWQRIENPFFDLYEIRLDDNFGDEEDEENLFDTTKGTSYNLGYLSEGVTYYLAAKNTAGRYGESTQITVFPPQVNPVVNLTSNPEPDSEAFIDWEQPEENYSIIGYEVKRNLAGESADEPTATSLGLFDSTFVSVREQTTGTYNYWVATKDASLRLSSWQSVSVDFIKSLNAASEIIEDTRERLEIVEFDVDELEQGFQQTTQDLADASDRIDQAEQNISDAADRLDGIDFDLGKFETELTDFKIDTDANFTQIGQRASDLEFRVQTETLTREESDLAILSSISNQAASREVLRQRNENNERLIDAVVTVDPETGQIINRAFQYTDEQFTQAVFLIDGAEAKITATVESIGLIEGEISDLSSQLELVPAQITATATSIVADAISALEPAHVFNFFDSAQGWFAVNGDITTATPNQVNLNWGDIQNDNLNFIAEDNPLVRLTIERTGGSGWVGDLIVERDDSTTETFTGIIEDIPVSGEIVRNIDLRGNENWSGTITSMRLVIGEDSNDTFIVKNITIGKPDAALLELEDITSRVTNAESQIDALEGTITQKVDTTFYNDNTVTFGNVEQTLNAIDSYAELLVQSQQIDENDVITNATNAGQFIDGYEGTFTNYVTEIKNEFDDVRDEYQSEFTDVRTELDSANGRITNQSFSIFQNREESQELGIQQLQSLVDVALFRSGQLDKDSNFAFAIQQLETDVSSEGALAKAITDVEAATQVNDERLNAQSVLLQEVSTDVEGNADSLAALSAGVTGETDPALALLKLEAYLGEGGLGARASLVTDVNNRLTGVIVEDDGVTRDLAFLTDRAYFVDASGTKRIFFDLNEQEFTFDGIIKAKGGEFAGELLAATGTFEGSLEAADGTFTGNLVAATGTFEGELTAGSIVTNSTITGSKFLTSDGTDYRVVIDPENNIPFWYGAGADVNETNSTLMLKSDGSAIFKGELLGATGTFGGQLTAATGSFEGNLLAGSIVSDSTVTGSTITGGVIRTSAGTGFRTVIDPSNGYALWYGDGDVNDDNAQLMFKTDGTAEYRGFFDGELAANSVRVGNIDSGAVLPDNLSSELNDVIDGLSDDTTEALSRLANVEGNVTDLDNFIATALEGETIIQGGFLRTELIAAESIAADKLSADFVLSKKVDVVNSGQRVLIDPEGDLQFWVGDDNITPSKNNGVFWASNDGDFSRFIESHFLTINDSFAVLSGNSVTLNLNGQSQANVEKSGIHKTVKGLCKVKVVMGNVRITSNQGAVDIQILRNGVAVKSRLYNVRMAAVSGDNYTTAIAEMFIEDNGSEDYGTEVVYGVRVSTLSANIVFDSLTLETIEVRQP